MIVTLDARGQDFIVIPVTDVISDIFINNGVRGQFLTLIFIQDATGHSVAVSSGNIQGFLTPSATAFAITAESFIYNQQSNTFISTVPAGAGTVTSVFTRTGAVVATTGDYTVAQVTGAAPLASPALSGNPTAPTQTPGNNSTRLATTAYSDAGSAVVKALLPVYGARAIVSLIQGSGITLSDDGSGNVTLSVP